MIPRSHVGPLVLLDGEAGADDIELAARLTARFSKGRDADRVTVEVNDGSGTTRTLDVEPLPAEQIPQDWYL
jgi:hypothetical protein